MTVALKKGMGLDATDLHPSINVATLHGDLRTCK
jgi:hypothetical protein